MATKKHKIKTEIHPMGFMVITCPEGDYITSWKEGDDYLNYSATKIIYTKKMDKPEDVYHCISEAEHEKYQKLHEEAEEERRIRMEKEMEENHE